MLFEIFYLIFGTIICWKLGTHEARLRRIEKEFIDTEAGSRGAE